MSVIIQTFIFCDKCDLNGNVDSYYDTAAESRRMLKSAGWIRRGSRDYCPDCKNQREEANEQKR